MGCRIEISCPKCGKTFLTKHRTGHWEDCPLCGYSFYATHNARIRRILGDEKIRGTQNARRPD